MPGYGHLTGGAAFGFFNPVRGPVDVGGQSFDVAVERTHSEASLLAHNFNDLWCWALNVNRNVARVDYFAMLHSDVEPESGWLGKMIEEMERVDADLLSAVVPIKNRDGMTSTALENPNGDPWRPLCRLTMREVYSLPETFTREDTGRELLLNTGCWVCRFDQSWVADVCFEICDRIVFDESQGLYRAEVEAEDWRFSRKLRGMGLKLAATRKVKLNHAGMQRFPNSGPWGSHHFDRDYVAESVLDAAELAEA